MLRQEYEPEPSYLARLQEERSDEAKVRRKQLHRGSLKAIRAV